MLAREMLSTLGYPVHTRTANDLGTVSRLQKLKHIGMVHAFGFEKCKCIL